jgi:Aspartyl protease
VRCSLQRGAAALPADTLILLDTGADLTTLPRQFAALLGFSDADLDSVSASGLGGKATVWKPKAGPPVEIRIGDQWYPLPGVAFADRTPPLLGRDLVFRYFKLRMQTGETELLPIS